MTPITSREIVDSEDRLKRKRWSEGWIFVLAMWLLSRLVIIVAMQLIAPLIQAPPTDYDYTPLGFTHNFVPKAGWELFTHWDGAWYRQIATTGYDYANDGQKYPVAFFPLFPLITRGVMSLGLPFDVAGPLVNNFALLGALFFLYRWAEERFGVKEAKWSTAVLAWCPFSVFGTVAYTEGLFLLVTTAALRAFDNQQHGRAAFWGALATATRATGTALVPAFLFVAWREKRSKIAYAAGLASVGGLLLFSAYCGLRFGNPIAFIHVQEAWGDQPTWGYIASHALSGNKDSLIKLIMFLGGGYLLWHLRNKLPLVALAYGVFSLAIIGYSGVLQSVSRYVYAIASLSLALGLVLANHPRWGYAIIGFFALLLGRYAIRFAWWDWFF